MKVQYFFRHPKNGHSIHRVFRTIINGMNESVEAEVHEVPCEGSLPHHLLQNNIFTFRKRKMNSVHHVTGHIHDVLLSLIGVKTVLTIHDLVFLDNVKNPFKRAYKWLFWLYLPIKIADRVVCISHQTKKGVLSKLKTDKITVIYNAVDPIFKPINKKFNDSKPVILHIGTGWNKNLECTIQALEGIECHLRIIGELQPKQLQKLKFYGIDFSTAKDLTDLQIQKEYENCDIVNFPSIYEGFGMPVIEGQRTGRIVVTSNIEPLVEVSNKAAVLINPENVMDLKAAYLKIISDSDYRNEIIKRGLENSERFTVTEVTEQYIHLYQQLSTNNENS